MSIGRCGASWAASVNSSAPWRCASAASSASGHTSPVTFEAPVTATRSNPGRAARRLRSQRSSSSPAEPASGSRRSSCRRHGSMLAWCSAAELSTRVPAGSAAASTLTASVVLPVNTTRSSLRAPTKPATSARASSYAAVATCDLRPLPRWTLLYQGRKASTASHTPASAGVLAAWSRST
jgi:hypothetical protein